MFLFGFVSDTVLEEVDGNAFYCIFVIVNLSLKLPSQVGDITES